MCVGVGVGVGVRVVCGVYVAYVQAPRVVCTNVTHSVLPIVSAYMGSKRPSLVCPSGTSSYFKDTFKSVRRTLPNIPMLEWSVNLLLKYDN